MAKFTDYTEKTEPVDTDLALIYDTPAKVNKKFTFGNLWKWIAKKIVSEGISQLDTTNKTIPGAINELNSKTITFEIPTDEAKLNTDFQIAYPSGFNRQNCLILGVRCFNKDYLVWYSYIGKDETMILTLGNNIIFRSYVSAYIGNGAKIEISLFRVK